MADLVLKSRQTSQFKARREAAPPRHDTPAHCFPRLAFVHIPKTAGTSITRALTRHYDSLTCPAMTTLDYRAYSEDALGRFRFYKGHAYRSDYERLPGGTTRFTVLRDPVSRALSYFNYCRGLDDTKLADPCVREACRIAKTASAIEFIYSDSPVIVEHIRLGQMRQFLPNTTLSKITHRQFLTRELRQRVVAECDAELRRFDYVLTVDFLRLSFPLMAKEIGLQQSITALSWENRSAPADDIDPTDVRRALIDVNAAEFEVYASAQRVEQAWLTQTLSLPLN